MRGERELWRKRNKQRETWRGERNEEERKAQMWGERDVKKEMERDEGGMG